MPSLNCARVSEVTFVHLQLSSCAPSPSPSSPPPPASISILEHCSCSRYPQPPRGPISASSSLLLLLFGAHFSTFPSLSATCSVVGRRRQVLYPHCLKCLKVARAVLGNLGSISSFTFTQKQALALSWRLLRPQASNLFRKILLELEVASPKVKQIFYKAALVDAFNKDEDNSATLDAHIKLLVKFLDDVISCVDDETECVGKIRAIGSCHAVLQRSCNFSNDIWEKLGEIAMERICSNESVMKTREAGKGWRMLLAFMVDELRTGFEGEIRQHRKSSSADHIDSGSPGGEEEAELRGRLRQLRLDYNSTMPYT